MRGFIPKMTKLMLERKSFTTLFQCHVVVEKKGIAVMGFPYHGCIVRRAVGIPRCLPTKDELVKSIQFLPEEQFVAQMKLLSTIPS